MSLRIGLNATCFSARPSGANQRFRYLIDALIRRQPDWHFIIYEPRDVRISEWFAGAPNIEARATPLPSEGRAIRLLKGIGYWRRTLRADRLDLFETFHLPAVVAPDCPTLLTVHDLRQVRTKSGWAMRLIAAPVLHHAVARARLTLAVSNTVAAELQAFHPGARIRTLYNGVRPEDMARPDDIVCNNVRARWKLPVRFVLCVGHLEARKNIEQAIAATAVLRARGQTIPLVVVGNPGGAKDVLGSMIARHGLKDQVQLLSGVTSDDLCAMYHLADLLLFPSSYEGFGIPLIEAMSVGLPIAVSDTPVFRELAGGAARFFALGDPADTANAVAALWHSPAERAALTQAGQALLPRHDFTVLADQLAMIYREVSAS